MNNIAVIEDIKSDLKRYLPSGIDIVGSPDLEIRHTSFFVKFSLSNQQELYAKILKYKDIDGQSLYKAIHDSQAKDMGRREYFSYTWFKNATQEIAGSKDLNIRILPILTYLNKWNAIVSYKVKAKDLYLSLRESQTGDELYRVGQWLYSIHQEMDIEWRDLNTPDDLFHNLSPGYEKRMISLFTPLKLAYANRLIDFDCRDILVEKNDLYCLDLCLGEDLEPQLYTVGRFVTSLELLYWGTKGYGFKPVSRHLINAFMDGYFEKFPGDLTPQKKMVRWFTAHSLLRHSWQVSQRKSNFHKAYNAVIGRPCLRYLLNRYYLH